MIAELIVNEKTPKKNVKDKKKEEEEKNEKDRV